ncbi:hypothetical protein ACPCG0_10340 [Propionibacteriaceae bacterium Y1923]|uniref:hypothetical protein n=1 Tax=Aestuariimicrobium sp. Y1814 TaxID=3418742 RepID=UPI003C27524C
MEVFTTAALLSSGCTRGELAAALKTGELVHLARGFYARMDPGKDDRVVQHLAMAAACSPDDVLALESAALVHGLPLAGWPPALVQTVQDGNGRSRKRGIRHIRSAPLPAEHIAVVNGMRVTTRARTVVDLARLCGLNAGLIAWERARWDARVARELAAFDAATGWAVHLLAGRHGIERARLVLQFASAWSESPMESLSRLAFSRLSLPMPVQQYVVRDSFGTQLGVADFAWPEQGVLGEYDGQDKYDRLARPGEAPADVVRREKRRQEGMEAEGWVFARWGKEEVAHPRRLEARVLAAFQVAAGRPRAAG